MKKITVADILNLDALKEARIVAGKEGLQREVRYVNVIDKPPSSTNHETDAHYNDIYLSYLYFATLDKKFFDTIYEHLIENHAAALIIFDEYIQQLPEKYIHLFNKAKIPVAFIDYHTPYSLIISSIIEFRIHNEQCKNIEDKLFSLTGSRISQDEKMTIMRELNPNFEKNAIALFAIDHTNPTSMPSRILNLSNTIAQNTRAFIAEYRGGLLTILTFSDSRTNDIEQAIQNTIASIHQHLPEASIGISDLRPLPTLGTAISQSYTALSSGRAAAGEVVFYRELGISRILLALYNTPALEDFYRDMTEPILKSDHESNGQLFQTMLCFASHDMDYKKTAQAMYVHENTVRYRINKVKELIPYGNSEVDFHDTLSMTYKIYLIKSF